MAGGEVPGVFDGDEYGSFRAFCEHPGCTWSSASHESEFAADAELVEHAWVAHPGEPVNGTIDETET